MEAPHQKHSKGILQNLKMKMDGKIIIKYKNTKYKKNTPAIFLANVCNVCSCNLHPVELIQLLSMLHCWCCLCGFDIFFLWVPSIFRWKLVEENTVKYLGGNCWKTEFFFFFLLTALNLSFSHKQLQEKFIFTIFRENFFFCIVIFLCSPHNFRALAFYCYKFSAVYNSAKSGGKKLKDLCTIFLCCIQNWSDKWLSYNYCWKHCELNNVSWTKGHWNLYDI